MRRKPQMNYGSKILIHALICLALTGITQTCVLEKDNVWYLCPNNRSTMNQMYKAVFCHTVQAAYPACVYEASLNLGIHIINSNDQVAMITVLILVVMLLGWSTWFANTIIEMAVHTAIFAMMLWPLVVIHNTAIMYGDVSGSPTAYYFFVILILIYSCFKPGPVRMAYLFCMAASVIYIRHSIISAACQYLRGSKDGHYNSYSEGCDCLSVCAPTNAMENLAWYLKWVAAVFTLSDAPGVSADMMTEVINQLPFGTEMLWMVVVVISMVIYDKWAPSLIVKGVLLYSLGFHIDTMIPCVMWGTWQTIRNMKPQIPMWMELVVAPSVSLLGVFIGIWRPGWMWYVPARVILTAAMGIHRLKLSEHHIGYMDYINMESKIQHKPNQIIDVIVTFFIAGTMGDAIKLVLVESLGFVPLFVPNVNQIIKLLYIRPYGWKYILALQFTDIRYDIYDTTHLEKSPMSQSYFGDFDSVWMPVIEGMEEAIPIWHSEFDIEVSKIGKQYYEIDTLVDTRGNVCVPEMVYIRLSNDVYMSIARFHRFWMADDSVEADTMVLPAWRSAGNSRSKRNTAVNDTRFVAGRCHDQYKNYWSCKRESIWMIMKNQTMEIAIQMAIFIMRWGGGMIGRRITILIMLMVWSSWNKVMADPYVNAGVAVSMLPLLTTPWWSIWRTTEETPRTIAPLLINTFSAQPKTDVQWQYDVSRMTFDISEAVVIMLAGMALAMYCMFLWRMRRSVGVHCVFSVMSCIIGYILGVSGSVMFILSAVIITGVTYYVGGLPITDLVTVITVMTMPRVIMLAVYYAVSIFVPLPDFNDRQLFIAVFGLCMGAALEFVFHPYCASHEVVERDNTGKLISKTRKFGIIGHLLFGSSLAHLNPCIPHCITAMETIPTSMLTPMQKFCEAYWGDGLTNPNMIKILLANAEKLGKTQELLEGFESGKLEETFWYPGKRPFPFDAQLIITNDGNVSGNGVRIRLGNQLFILTNSHVVCKISEFEQNLAGKVTNYGNIGVMIDGVIHETQVVTANSRCDLALLRNVGGKAHVKIGKWRPGMMCIWSGRLPPFRGDERFMIPLVSGVYGSATTKLGEHGDSGSGLYNEEGEIVAMKWGMSVDREGMITGLNHYIPLFGLKKLIPDLPILPSTSFMGPEAMINNDYSAQFISESAQLRMDLENAIKNEDYDEIKKLLPGMANIAVLGKSIQKKLTGEMTVLKAQHDLKKLQLTTNEDYLALVGELEVINERIHTLNEFGGDVDEDDDVFKALRLELQQLRTRVREIESELPKRVNPNQQKINELALKRKKLRAQLNDMEGEAETGAIKSQLKTVNVELAELLSMKEKLGLHSIPTRMPTTLAETRYPYCYKDEDGVWIFVETPEKITKYSIHPSMDPLILNRYHEFGYETRKAWRVKLQKMTTTKAWHDMVTASGLYHWIKKLSGAYQCECPFCGFSYGCEKMHLCNNDCHNDVFNQINRHVTNCRTHWYDGKDCIYIHGQQFMKKDGRLCYNNMQCTKDHVCMYTHHTFQQKLDKGQLKLRQWYKINSVSDPIYVMKTCADQLLLSVQTVQDFTTSGNVEFTVDCNIEDVPDDKLTPILTALEKLAEQQSGMMQRMEKLPILKTIGDRLNVLSEVQTKLNHKHNEMRDMFEDKMAKLNIHVDKSMLDLTSQFNQREKQQYEVVMERLEVMAGQLKDQESAMKAVGGMVATQNTIIETLNNEYEFDELETEVAQAAFTKPKKPSALRRKARREEERNRKATWGSEVDLREQPSKPQRPRSQSRNRDEVAPAGLMPIFVKRVQGNQNLHNQLTGTKCECVMCCCKDGCTCEVCVGTACIWCNSNTHPTIQCECALQKKCPKCAKVLNDWYNNFEAGSQSWCCCTAEVCVVCRGPHHPMNCPIINRSALCKKNDAVYSPRGNGAILKSLVIPMIPTSRTGRTPWKGASLN